MSSVSDARHDAARSRDVTVVELLDRLLDKGVVLAGDLTISVAGVDLVELSLRVLLCSTDAAERAGVAVPSATDALSKDALGSRALHSRAVHSRAVDAHALDADALDTQAVEPGGAGGDAGPGPFDSGALGAEMLGASEDDQE